jgi:hypothetical protein
MKMTVAYFLNGRPSIQFSILKKSIRPDSPDRDANGPESPLTETSFPGGKSPSVFGFITASVSPVEIAQVVDGIAFQTESGPLFRRQSGQHLVENVVVFLLSQRPDHAGLVQEVAVDLGPIKGTVGDLNFDEMTLFFVQKGISFI